MGFDKRGGWNTRGGWKIFMKSINMEGGFFLWRVSAKNIKKLNLKKTCRVLHLFLQLKL